MPTTFGNGALIGAVPLSIRLTVIVVQPAANRAVRRGVMCTAVSALPWGMMGALGGGGWSPFLYILLSMAGKGLLAGLLLGLVRLSPPTNLPARFSV